MRDLCIGKLALIFGMAVYPGCLEATQQVKSSWHEKFNWNAEDYFNDRQVIALCRAIEANDLAEIDRLVAAGADVNAKGKGNMTPLLWAFPDNKLDRFERLLEHGANPNVIVESDFGTRGAIMIGSSVTHLATGTAFPGYFEAVFAYGGDPNLENKTVVGSGDTPIFTVIKYGGAAKKQQIRFLIDKGANLNHQNASDTTATRLAVGWGGQYDIALILLNAGADHRTYKPMENSRLIHSVVAEERRRETWTSQQKSDYQKLVKWLEARGESIEEARADINRWVSWSATTGEYRRKMDAEIAARKAREAREKKSDNKLERWCSPTPVKTA